MTAKAKILGIASGNENGIWTVDRPFPSTHHTEGETHMDRNEFRFAALMLAAAFTTATLVTYFGYPRGVTDAQVTRAKEYADAMERAAAARSRAAPDKAHGTVVDLGNNPRCTEETRGYLLLDRCLECRGQSGWWRVPDCETLDKCLGIGSLRALSRCSNLV